MAPLEKFVVTCVVVAVTVGLSYLIIRENRNDKDDDEEDNEPGTGSGFYSNDYYPGVG